VLLKLEGLHSDSAWLKLSEAVTSSSTLKEFQLVKLQGLLVLKGC